MGKTDWTKSGDENYVELILVHFGKLMEGLRELNMYFLFSIEMPTIKISYKAHEDTINWLRELEYVRTLI